MLGLEPKQDKTIVQVVLTQVLAIRLEEPVLWQMKMSISVPTVEHAMPLVIKIPLLDIVLENIIKMEVITLMLVPIQAPMPLW